jgi:hypothetical protein
MFLRLFRLFLGLSGSRDPQLLHLDRPTIGIHQLLTSVSLLDFNIFLLP